MDNTEIADVLERALQLMNDEGAHWTQFQYERPSSVGTKFCAVGAINKVLGRDNRGAGAAKLTADSERDAVLEALARDLPDNHEYARPWDQITGWNDNEDREWADIVEQFNQTAARLRAS